MKNTKQRSVGWLVAAALTLAGPVTALAGDETPAKAVITSKTGSGERYTTTITSKTEGELKPEDFRQASVLGSRILTHVNNAARFLAEEKADDAKAELEKAQTLAKVVHDLLPVTTVSTITTDAQGKEVYRYEDRVQNDQIPIFEGMINVEVVQPIIDAKKEQASLQGLQLADANVIHTTMLLDLPYVESKIGRALAKLNEPGTALIALLAAQSDGVRFSAQKEDHPLVQIQAALRLAEQQVREQKFDGAKANLELARVQLEAYRTLVGDAAGKEALGLQQEINALQEKVREPGAADKIRDYWNRVAGWFKQEAGQAQRSSPAQHE